MGEAWQELHNRYSKILYILITGIRSLTKKIILLK